MRKVEVAMTTTTLRIKIFYVEISFLKIVSCQENIVNRFTNNSITTCLPYHVMSMQWIDSWKIHVCHIVIICHISFYIISGHEILYFFSQVVVFQSICPSQILILSPFASSSTFQFTSYLLEFFEFSIPHYCCSFSLKLLLSSVTFLSGYQTQ